MNAQGELLARFPLHYTDMEFGHTGQYRAVEALLASVPADTQCLQIREGGQHVSDYHLQGVPRRFAFITHNVRASHVPNARAAPATCAVAAVTAVAAVAPPAPAVQDDDDMDIPSSLFD